jgi:hypothetical protein
LINNYIEDQHIPHTPENWVVTKNERTALIFIACILEYDKNKTEMGKTNILLKNYLTIKEDKNLSRECLESLKKHKKIKHYC